MNGMISIFHWSHAVQSFLPALCVVPGDVIIYFSDQGVDTVEDFAVKHFSFEMAKEIFHHCVVVAVAFTRH